MLIIKRYHQLWWHFVIVLNFVYNQSGLNVKGISLDIDENIVQKICQMKFCDASKTDCSLDYCMEQMSTETKFGECTNTIKSSNRSPSDICFDDCNGQDYRCSAAEKCCWNHCNRSCEAILNLDRIPLLILPAIPINITIYSVEYDSDRTAEISWQMRSHHNWYDEHIDYIIESRAHIGNTFLKHKLSQWYTINGKSISTDQRYSQINFKIRYRIELKIGRWYEFRILSLNGNGTRGYSTVSQPFQLNEKPKHLPIPNDFKIDILPKLLANNSVYTKLSWKLQDSDYPIETIEFSWSRFIQEGNGSLLMEKILLPEFQNYFELWNLLPDQYYYMQVNALSSFGRKRLRSDKVSIFLNTTIVQSETRPMPNSRL